MLAQCLFGNELLPATGYTKQAHALRNLLRPWLVLELPREDIDLVAHAAQTFAELQNVHDLAARIGLAQLRLRGYVPVGRNHQDALSV